MEDTRQTILIVDDDRDIINVLRAHFKERNCETVATADPSTVVSKLKNFSVKLMLLDLKMKKLDGFQVLDKIKQAGLALPPTLIITGFLPKYLDRLREYRINLDDVVSKPFDFELMERAVNRKLGPEVMRSSVSCEYESKIYETNRCHIGFVEDEGDILEILSSSFKGRNYKVSGFTDAKAALEAIKKDTTIDILVVDIKLPGMQGDELIRLLSELPKHPYIIPMSGDPPSDEMKKELERLGCTYFLEKPLHLDQMIEVVKRIAMEKGLVS